MRFIPLIVFIISVFSSACKNESPADFVDVAEYCPGIVLDIKYATPNNFTGEAVYPEAKCYVRRFVADRLNKVQQELQEQGYGLLIWDGYRPQRVQYKFWELVPDPRYVADPSKGSRHNRGCAVDVSLVDAEGNYIEMPTDYDDFSEKAHLNYDQLTTEQIKNRELLHRVMTKNGFTDFESEWWHYDAIGWEDYPIMDLPFDSLN